MKQAEIKELSNDELVDRVGIEKKALINLKISHSISSIENPITLRVQRRKIARLLTEMVKRKKASN